MLTRMDPNSLAEELPSLYRAILDRVAELEAAGRSTEAARMRTSATQIYSRAWDERARRRLTDLLARHARPAAGATPASNRARPVPRPTRRIRHRRRLLTGRSPSRADAVRLRRVTDAEPHVTP